MANINKIKLSGTTYNIQDLSAAKTVELTQAQYDALVSGGTVDPNTFYVITDAQGADLSNYYTKSETSGATQISTALNAKQDTLVSGTNIKTINNTSILGSGNITIQGGGSSYTAGRGIDITNDTISVSLPISAGTASDNSALIFNNKNNISSAQLSTAFGIGTTAGGRASFSIGASTYATGEYSFVGGNSSQAIGNNSFAFGYAAKAKGQYSIAIGSYYTLAENNTEVALGKANVSNTGSTDADKTLFSVGNGTSSSNRHNAFEIRQNGDIYLTKNGQDVKLQDQLGGGGSITIDTSLDSGSTNAISNAAVSAALNKNFYFLYNVSAKQIGGRAYKEAELRYVNPYRDSSAMTTTLSFATINNNGIIGVDSNFSLVEISAITTSISSSSTDAQVPSAKAVNDKLGGLSLVKLTQAEYDALTTKDDNTVYFIGDSTNGYTMKIGSANVN